MSGAKNFFSLKGMLINSAFSLLIIVAVVYFIGIDKIAAEFGSINYFYLFLSAVFLLIMYAGMAFRLQFVLSCLGEKTRFWDVFKIHVLGMLLADFTPARTGYLAVAYALSKKLKIAGEKTTVAVIGPQIYDFILKVVVGTAAMFYLVTVYLKSGHTEILFLGAFAMLGIISIMALLLFSKRFLALFFPLRKISFADKLISIFEGAQKNSGIIIRQFPALFALLLFTWSTKAVSWYFVAKAIGITFDPGFPEVSVYFFLQPLLTILEFIPTPTLAGLGLSEGGGVLVFSLFGIGAAKAASFVFLARIKTIIINLPAVSEALEILKPD